MKDWEEIETDENGYGEEKILLALRVEYFC